MGEVAEGAQPPHLVLVTWSTVDGGDVSRGSHWTLCLHIPLPAEGKEVQRTGLEKRCLGVQDSQPGSVAWLVLPSERAG